MSLEKLLEYHISHEDKRLMGIEKSIERIESKVENLVAFKEAISQEAKTNSKWISFVVSSVAGIVTLSITVILKIIGTK